MALKPATNASLIVIGAFTLIGLALLLPSRQRPAPLRIACCPAISPPLRRLLPEYQATTGFRATILPENADADVLITARTHRIDELQASGLVQSQTSVARGCLVLIQADGVEPTLRSLAQLADPAFQGAQIALADPGLDPEGTAASHFMNSIPTAKWNPHKTPDSAASLQALDPHRLPLAIVPSSLTMGRENRGLPIPMDPITYEAVVLRKASAPATRLLGILTDDRGLQTLADYGFDPPQAHRGS